MRTSANQEMTIRDNFADPGLRRKLAYAASAIAVSGMHSELDQRWREKYQRYGESMVAIANHGERRKLRASQSSPVDKPPVTSSVRMTTATRRSYEHKSMS